MAEKTVKQNPESPKPRKKKKKSASVLPMLLLTLIAVAGVCGGTWLVLTGLDRKAAEEIAAQSSVIETEPGTTVTTEVTTTTETTTTTQRSLPPGSVTGISLSFTEVVMKVGDDTVMPLVTMTPEDAEDKSEKWESSDKSVATVDDIGRITPVGAGSCIIKVTSVNNPDVFAEVSVRVADPDAPATTAAPAAATSQTTAKPKNTAEVDGLEVKDGATYVHGILIANKSYALPKTYNPGGLTKETMDAFHELEKAGADAGYTYTIVSGFRSYEEQDTLYHNYVNRDGKAEADTYSARPGHSEHQTGLAMDLNCAGSAFHNTPEAKWLAENCWKYGFIIRFPKGKEDKTGYMYESWHIRYVGKDWAKKIYDSGLCLEEYFNLESKYAED